MTSQIKIKPYKKIEGKSYSSPQNIILKDSAFKGVPYKGDQTTFFFFNCFFKKLSIKNSESIEFDEITIHFFGCYIEDLEISQIESKNISLIFASTIMSGTINNHKLKSIKFNNSIFSDSIFLSNINNLQISYTEENIFPRVWSPLLNKISIDFEDLIKLKQSIYIYDHKKTVIYFHEDNESKPGLYKRPHEKLKSYKIGYKLNDKQKATFNLNILFKNSINTISEETKLVNVKIKSLTLSGNFNGKTSIENAIIDNWYISEFKSELGANFYNIYPSLEKGDKNLSIHKSNFDNVWFDNVDFDKFSKISFYRSIFSNTKFSSCTFPSSFSTFSKFMPIENIHYPERKSESYQKDQYEMLLQLKKAFESTGNYFESQKIQSIAHQALEKIENIPIGDKIILFINNISNKHTTSIYRPFWLLILFSVIFYICYLWSLNRIFINTEIDPNLIGYYFSFLDLTHRIDFLVSKENLNGMAIFIDYLSKIITGFFTYQFIASFRRYGKSK